MSVPMDRPAVRALALEALHKATGLLDDPAHARLRQDGDRDVAFAELELDSLSTLEILMELEDATGLELDPELLPELATLNGLVDHVVALCGDARPVA